MKDGWKKIWNYRLPFRNRYTTALGIIFLCLAIFLIVRFYLYR